MWRIKQKLIACIKQKSCHFYIYDFYGISLNLFHEWLSYFAHMVSDMPLSQSSVATFLKTDGNALCIDFWINWMLMNLKWRWRNKTFQSWWWINMFAIFQWHPISKEKSRDSPLPLSNEVADYATHSCSLNWREPQLGAGAYKGNKSAKNI